MPYYKLYKNWLHVVYFIYRQNDEIRLKLRSGKTLNMNLKDALNYTFKNYYGIEGGYIKINQFRFKLNDGSSDVYNGDISACFIREEYKWLKPKGNIIIDIGANIADSSIYFASQGATKVIALEPYPYSYRLAQENILNNSYNEKIILVNAGYGNDSEIYVKDTFTTGESQLIPSIDGIRIKIFSLETLLDKYNIDSAILKMDCEGCEYNLLNESNDTLRRFKRIEMEYHYGYERLKKRLENAGFKVRYTKPVLATNNQNMHIGYIYAKRK